MLKTLLTTTSIKSSCFCLWIITILVLMASWCRWDVELFLKVCLQYLHFFNLPTRISLYHLHCHHGNFRFSPSTLCLFQSLLHLLSQVGCSPDHLPFGWQVLLLDPIRRVFISQPNSTSVLTINSSKLSVLKPLFGFPGSEHVAVMI